MTNNYVDFLLLATHCRCSLLWPRSVHPLSERETKESNRHRASRKETRRRPVLRPLLYLKIYEPLEQVRTEINVPDEGVHIACENSLMHVSSKDGSARR